MCARKKYDYANPRLPAFTSRFKALVDTVGGVTRTSEITGISRPTINFWYNGERTPDAENLITISESFHVSVDYLLGLSGPDNSTKDEKLAFVCEYTGLSNEAINKIRVLKEKSASRAYIDLLDCVISDPNFEYFLGILEGYFSEEQTIEGTLAMSSVKANQKDFAIFAASNSLRDILDTVEQRFAQHGFITTEKRLDILMEKKLEALEGKNNGKH